jgi:putative transposase
MALHSTTAFHWATNGKTLDREVKCWSQAAFEVSKRRVSRLLPIQLATLRYKRRRTPQTALRMRLRELAATRVRFGYRRLTVC